MKILNYGSINKDFIYTVKDFVRPGETIKTKGFKDFLGGKGLNQSVAVAKSGIKIFHAGCINKKDSQIKNYLENWGVDTKNIFYDDEPTGHAIIQVNKKGENSILIHGGANRKINSKHIEKTISQFNTGDFLIIQNEINKVPEIIERANHQKMRIIFNPAPFTEEVLNYPLEKVDTIIYNESEGKGLSGYEKINEIKSNLLEKYPMLKQILTLGNQGSIYFDKENEIPVKAIKAKTIDTTGAGDTFVGYYVSSLSKKMKIKDCLLRASKAAGITTEKLGGAVSIPSID